MRRNDQVGYRNEHGKRGRNYIPQRVTHHARDLAEFVGSNVGNSESGVDGGPGLETVVASNGMTELVASRSFAHGGLVVVPAGEHNSEKEFAGD